MRGSVAVVVQLVVSLLIVGAVTPPLLAMVPAARSGRTGVAMVIAGVMVVFVLLRLAWPRPKQH